MEIPLKNGNMLSRYSQIISKHIIFALVKRQYYDDQACNTQDNHS